MHKNLKMLRKLERKDSKTLKNKMPKMKLISKKSVDRFWKNAKEIMKRALN